MQVDVHLGRSPMDLLPNSNISAVNSRDVSATELMATTQPILLSLSSNTSAARGEGGHNQKEVVVHSSLNQGEDCGLSGVGKLAKVHHSTQ